MATSKLFDPKLFLEEYVKELPEYQSKALTELDFRQHEERLMALMQSQYAVPKELITGGMRSGRSAAIAELEALVKKRGIKVVRPTPGPIKGKRAEWMCIDEAVKDLIRGDVHPNCRCETVPVAASSLNVTTAHDDMLDALALTFGLSRTDGEPDDSFRSRVRAMMSSRHRDVRSVAAEFEGVLNVGIRETEPGKAKLIVTLEPSADRPTHRADIAIAVENARPAGVHVDVEFEVAPVVDEDEETDFIRRLRSKILERYPDGK